MLSPVFLSLGISALSGGATGQVLPPSRVEAWRRARVLSRRQPRRRPVRPEAAPEARLRPTAAPPRRSLRWTPVARARSGFLLRRRASAREVPAVLRPAPRAPAGRRAPSPPRLLPTPGDSPPASGAHLGGVRAAPGPPRGLSGAACLSALRRLGVSFRSLGSTRGVATPVRITGPLGGVKLRPMWGTRPAVMDCRFAITLVRLSPIIRAAGFDELRYSSFYSYRNVGRSRRLSRHANGLAVDIHELRGPGGVRAHVERDYVKHRGRPGACVGAVSSSAGRRLRQLACGIEASGLVYLVLTPDSDYAHRNHFHISGLRSWDRPLRKRYAGRRWP